MTIMKMGHVKLFSAAGSKTASFHLTAKNYIAAELG